MIQPKAAHYAERAMHRKTTPKVKAGRVQQKNRWTPAPDDYHRVEQTIPVVDRKRPGDGYRHLLRRLHLEKFIFLLPDWDQLSHGLDAIVLAPGEWDSEGWWERGIVAVCAWDARLWTYSTPEYCASRREVMDRLGVPREDHGAYVLCKWTEGTARAYQLLDVLLHEFGHHRDHMTTRSRRDAARGEPFAEQYARRYGDMIWNRYMTAFGVE
jgi:hypothetical protein